MREKLLTRFYREKWNTPVRRIPSRVQIAWAAGFIEGEGSFSRASGTTPSVSASQLNVEPLRMLRKIFGGRIILKPKSKTSLSNGPTHVWRVSGQRAEITIYLIYPLLSKKRKAQARRCQCV